MAFRLIRKRKRFTPVLWNRCKISFKKWGLPTIIIRERVKYLGIVRARLLPAEWTLEDYLKYYPRMTSRERNRLTVYEAENMLMTAGRTQMLTQLFGTAPAAFGLQFSVGTGAISGVTSADTGIPNEFFRAAPSTGTTTGNQIDISTFFGALQANTTYTNAGLWGGAATGTLGSGTLMTHVLYALTKTSANSLTNDYLIQLL